jgi:hypothetical protein
MKLNARDRAQLVVVEYETGLVTPQTPMTPRPGMSSDLQGRNLRSDVSMRTL